MQNFNFLFLESDDQINFLTSQIIELDNIPINARYEKNPLTALAYLQELPPNQFPDAIIVAMHLSFMTGMEFAEAYVRKCYFRSPDTQLYLTAHHCSLKTITKVFHTNCISGFIAQPFSKNTFLETIVPNIHVSVV